MSALGCESLSARQHAVKFPQERIGRGGAFERKYRQEAQQQYQYVA